MPTLQAKDIIAILIIVALVIFKLTGHNGALDQVVAVMVGYYFAKRTTDRDPGI